MVHPGILSMTSDGDHDQEPTNNGLGPPYPRTMAAMGGFSNRHGTDDTGGFQGWTTSSTLEQSCFVSAFES